MTTKKEVMNKSFKMNKVFAIGWIVAIAIALTSAIFKFGWYRVGDVLSAIFSFAALGFLFIVITWLAILALFIDRTD